MLLSVLCIFNRVKIMYQWVSLLRFIFFCLPCIHNIHSLSRRNDDIWITTSCYINSLQMIHNLHLITTLLPDMFCHLFVGMRWKDHMSKAGSCQNCMSLIQSSQTVEHSLASPKIRTEEQNVSSIFKFKVWVSGFFKLKIPKHCMFMH